MHKRALDAFYKLKRQAEQEGDSAAVLSLQMWFWRDPERTTLNYHLADWPERTRLIGSHS